MKFTQFAVCILLLGTAAVMPTSAYTTDVSIDSSCHINVEGDVHFKAKLLTIRTVSGNEIVFDGNDNVLVNGDEIDLTRQQRIDAQLYYQSVTDAIPVTIDLATDAMTLASETVNEVIGDLLGHDDEMKDEINALFTDLESNLDDRFSSEDGGFVLRGSDLQHNGWASSVWENEFDERVDDLVSKVAGKLLISLGTEMLFGSGENSDMFSRLENLDTRIEERVEGKAEMIEYKAEELCLLLEKADRAENALSYSHDALTELNILSIHQDNAE